uniref:Uncharacterized protein n=1 Tax=Spongospora subterranea TaxID=70186 RepID=A0A0H5QG91_9EUKA|eukprot:CRZ00954.1 hypothetical protein [Spongospora subterranea]
MKISHIGIVNNPSCIYICLTSAPDSGQKAESRCCCIAKSHENESFYGRTSCFSIFSHPFNLLMIFHVAEVTSLLEELSMMVPAVEFVIMGHIIRWTDYTTPMATFETRPVV